MSDTTVATVVENDAGANDLDLGGGEDAACSNPCGQEPMGCSRCSKIGNDYPDHPDADFDDARYWSA